jgi:pentatricopeptide repeat protein
LKACGYVGALEKGKSIHADIIQNTSLESDLVVGIALIDMYAKCGLLANAVEVFEKLPERDVVSWNALVTGYALLGESGKVFCVVDRMLEESEFPNTVTFISILNACAHQGLVNRGRSCFEHMSEYYGITPSHEYFTCVIDLLGRTGQLEEAIGIIKKMNVEPDTVMWHTVLSACQKWGHSDLGKIAFDCAVHLDEKSAAAYVCMSNIYANASLQKTMGSS